MVLKLICRVCAHPPCASPPLLARDVLKLLAGGDVLRARVAARATAVRRRAVEAIAMGAKGGGALSAGLGNQDFGPRATSRLGKGLLVFFIVKCFSEIQLLLILRQKGRKGERTRLRGNCLTVQKIKRFKTSFENSL